MGDSKTARVELPLSRALLIEAAAWVARMSGPLRTEATEQGFAQWLRDDPLHRQAFVEITRDWERVAEYKHHAHVVISAAPEPAARTARSAWRKGPVLAWAAAVAVALIGAGWWFQGDQRAVNTAVGEQRVLTLDDGTKVHLNTATRLVVQYDTNKRNVRLDEGEALFEVARQAGRPFVVTAGGREVAVLGTTFLVRREPRRLSVTLIEGKVAVRDSNADKASLELEPGERVTFTPELSEPRLDKPSLPKLVAWQQGQVHIDDWPLSEAVAEMNRYSAVKIVIEDPQTAAIPLSGVFTAGHSMSFARAVAESYRLEVIDRGSTIVLAGIARRQAPTDAPAAETF